MSLVKYNKKRDFAKTTEPKGKKSPKNKENIFVIQKHDASHLHYDFRIEVDGVLKSWAIPKEPTITNGEKRLAIETEDHPLSYANFAGTIPKGLYGGGKVEIWDSGTFKNITENESAVSAIKNGHINMLLKGKKLKGGYSLILFKEEGKKKEWLFIKKKD